MAKKVLFLFLIFFTSTIIIHAEDNAEQQFQGFDLTGYDETGSKTWDIRGDRADIIGNIVKLTNIVANAYGDEQVHLTAENGALDKASSNIHLEKDVVITTETGTKMETDSLDWNRSQDLVQTDDRVKISRDNMVATGTGATAHPNLKTAQMNEDVDVKVDVQPKGEAGRVITITCDGPLEIDYAKQVAVFNNNVVIIDVGRKLTADKAELYFDQGTKKIKEIVCTGNVIIRAGENASYSDQAIYKADEQRVVLSGRPKIIFYTPEKE